MLYNPSYSESGVLKAAARTPRAVSTFDFEVSMYKVMNVVDLCIAYLQITCSLVAGVLSALKLVHHGAGASDHQESACAANVPR